MFDLLLDLSLYNTAVVLTAVFASLDHMRTSLNALTARKRDSKANGKPRKYFDYIPVIPWLQAMSANSIHAEKMRYRANHVHEPGVIKDVFDGSHYQSLLNTLVPGGEDNSLFLLF